MDSPPVPLPAVKSPPWHMKCDDTVESTTLEVKRLAGLSRSLLTRAEASEIFGGLRDHICSEFHHNTSRGSTANGNIEVNLRIRHFARRKCWYDKEQIDN